MQFYIASIYLYTIKLCVHTLYIASCAFILCKASFRDGYTMSMELGEKKKKSLFEVAKRLIFSMEERFTKEFK